MLRLLECNFSSTPILQRYLAATIVMYAEYIFLFYAYRHFLLVSIDALAGIRAYLRNDSAVIQSSFLSTSFWQANYA